jgi:peptidoglycan/xylan/chitin deacetylase (PgdA/CDA1 family)
MRNLQPLVSFTFDDFPRSALFQGGRILRNHGLKGTFFASFGLMGRVTPTGKMFSYDDLAELIRQEQEIGCHTFDHCHAWDTAPVEFEASIIRNRRAVAEYLPGTEWKALSYPISCPRPETKRRAAKHFTCCRGGGQSFNRRTVDLNNLNAFFIEQSRDNFNAIKVVIEDNARQNGWLIFATHDVSDSPTRFGCSPAVFEKAVRSSIQSGARILPVSEALEIIRALP